MKTLEETVKSKLKQKGVSESWMKDHLIVDVFDEEEDDDYCKDWGAPIDECTGYKCWIR